MILQLPPSVPELPHVFELPHVGPPHFLTITRLAVRADVARTVVLRQITQGLLIPDGFVELGTAAQPIFRESRAVDVLKNAQTPKNARAGSDE